MSFNTYWLYRFQQTQFMYCHSHFLFRYRCTNEYIKVCFKRPPTVTKDVAWINGLSLKFCRLANLLLLLKWRVEKLPNLSYFNSCSFLRWPQSTVTDNNVSTKVLSAFIKIPRRLLQLLLVLGNRSYNKIPPAGIGNPMFLPGSNKRRLAPSSLALPLRDFAAGASRKLSV